ncbi:MAG: hypothetical protein ACYSUU_00835 [Planctomycetota bacterium]|jgi:hypothetical protein
MTSPPLRRDLIFIAGLSVAGLLAFAGGGCGGEPPASSDPPSPVVDQAPKVADPVATSEPAEVGVAGPPAPTGAEPNPLPSPRLLITGATILTDFVRGEDGGWEAMALDESTVAVQDGAVEGIYAASNVVMRPNDVVVTGRGRYVMVAPLVRGDGDGSAWLEGGRLVDAVLAGIGGIILPDAIVESRGARCVTARTLRKEIPAAELIAATKGVEADRLVDLPTDGRVLDAFSKVLAKRIADGEGNIELLANLTRIPAEATGRPELGTIAVGTRPKLLVLEANPIENPQAILDPFAMVIDDRAARKAEILVLREASDRALGVREQVAGERPEVESPGPLRWWLNTTQGQVFGGAVASVEGGRLDYVAVSGRPRFDRAVGTLRLDPAAGEPNLELDYAGPPESFRIATTPTAEGLAVDLRIVDREAIEATSLGPSLPPIVDLAVDLDLHRERLMASEGVLEIDLQELLYGNGPIGLGPRRYRFTPIEPDACPPCFEGFERVWSLEILDTDAVPVSVAGTATVAFRAGRPARIQFMTGIDPVWVDEYPAVDRVPLD